MNARRSGGGGRSQEAAGRKDAAGASESADALKLALQVRLGGGVGVDLVLLSA